MRIPEFLADQHVLFETMVHAPAFTAQKLAKFLRVSGRYVVKSVLLRTTTGFVVAVLPASEHVDLRVVSEELGEKVYLANEDEIADHFRDCEHGVLSPFGRLYGLTTLLEASIPSDATIVFEAQQHSIAIRMSCEDFIRLERPTRLSFGVSPRMLRLV